MKTGVSCDGRCHNAKHQVCRCWCRGVFHGQAGEKAREAFREAMLVQEIPATLEDFKRACDQAQLSHGLAPGNTWRRAIEAARGERKVQTP